MTLEGAVALVTGGASGIGLAAVELLAAQGAKVTIVDVQADATEAAAAKVRELGSEALPIVASVTDPDATRDMVEQTVARWGRLDAAINNAGTSGTHALTADVEWEEWKRVVDLNLHGVFLSMKAEIPAMLASGGGAIVNTSSGAGLMGFPGLPAYVASKHGVIGLTKSAALEYGRKGIRVNAVCPGTVRSPMLEAFTGHDEATLQGMGKMMPIGRLATPQEIAEAMVWLLSPAASYVTGHAMAVDGGAAAQ